MNEREFINEAEAIASRIADDYLYFYFSEFKDELGIPIMEAIFTKAITDRIHEVADGMKHDYEDW